MGQETPKILLPGKVKRHQEFATGVSQLDLLWFLEGCLEAK